MSHVSSRVPFRVQPLPRPHKGKPDRRRARTGDPRDALELALTISVGRGSLDALILADEFGGLVAKGETRIDLEMLAAVTPLVGRGQAMAKIRRNGEERDLTVEAVTLCNEVFYVAAVGGENRSRRREVAASCAAARRILN
jgi:hypothetical protein